ncbi:MAG: ROK family protein, partial [Egibacteraceae bacterium]
MRVAGVDLGGTKIAVALVDADHRVVERARASTPAGGPDAIVAALVTAVGRLETRPDAVGVGAPGPVCDGVVLQATNLEGWTRPVPLAEQLSQRLDLPVTVENDVTAGTVGEWVAGAGRGAHFLLGVFLGTGCGGGLVLDGRPYRGAFGAGGEFGHMVVRAGGA